MKIVVALCVFFIVGTAHSQDNQQVTLLTFQEAVKIALTRNVTLNTQKNQLFAAQARKLQGYSNFLPNVFAQGNLYTTNGLQIDPTTGIGSNVSADNVNASVQANWTLFNGLGRLNTLQQNNLQFSAQTELVARAKQDVVFNVTSQYLTVLLDQELMRIAEENMNSQKVLLDQIKGFVEAGSRAVADEYIQDAQVKNLQVNYLRAKATLENDRALLAQTIQLDPSIPFEVVKPQGDLSTFSWKGASFDSLFSVAMNNRRDLKQQQFVVDAALRTMKVNAAAYYPNITLFASYGSTYFASDAYKNNPNIAPPESFREQFTHLYPALSYGLTFRIPIFNQMATRTNTVVARVTYENAILTRDNLLKSVKIDVQRVAKNYINAVEAFRASLTQVQAGELALQVQRESYELGIASQVVVAQANLTYIQSAASKAQAEVTLIFQKMLLDYALGTLDVDAIVNQQ